MDRRSVGLTLTLLLAAVAATPARAQFQPIVMRRPVTQYAQLVVGQWSGPASGVDVLALNAATAPSGLWWAHGVLFQDLLSDYLGPATVYAMASGGFDASAAGTAPDVIWGEHPIPYRNEVAVSWGEARTAPPSLFLDLTTSGWVWGAGSARLLDRAQALPLLVSGPSTTHSPVQLTAVDLAAARTAPSGPPPTLSWSLSGANGPHRSAEDGEAFDRVQPLRLSPTALQLGLDDVALPLSKGFYLLWHDQAPTGPNLATDLRARAVEFGTSGSQPLGALLPAGAPADRDVLGIAAADVDGDGVPDPVFSYGSEFYPGEPGWLLWIPNTGDVDAMSAVPPTSASAWRSLRADRPELQVVADAGILRPLDLGLPEPAFAVFDRTGGAIFVVTGNGASGFQVRSLPVAPGAKVRDMVAADVVGSPAKDLVVTADVTPTQRELWVYPDDGDLAPSLAWSPGTPWETLLGADLSLSVEASDPDGGFTLSWMRPYSPDVVGPSSITIPGAEICDEGSTVDVTVRALDALGVYVEIGRSIGVEAKPSLALDPSGPLVLVPGGTVGRATGVAWPGCSAGAPSYTWGQTGLSGIVETAVQPAGSSDAWREFTIPEVAYAEALSGVPELTLDATGATTTGSASGGATLELSLDASRLVAARAAFDRVALAPGEVGAARILVASAISVPLPRVRALVRLAGLAFAGPIQVTGAPATPGEREGEVVIDPLPVSPAQVELLVPVRSLGTPGGVSVELFSEGGHRLSPAASPAADAAAPPGCGCGDGGAGGAPIVLLLFLMISSPRPHRGRGQGEGARRGST